MENGRHVHLCLPISCSVFRELLDSVHDLMTVICVFAPKTPHSSSRFSVHTAKGLIGLVMELFGAITENGPYDLVNADTGNVQVSITIR
jgi:hypothetical protein